MPASVALALDGSPARAGLWAAVQLLEVEENADRPGALLIRLPVNRTSAGDLQFVGDGTFEPYTNVTVVITPAGQPSQCVFDGYVLSWQLHLDRCAQTSTVDVWAQDASWLMGISDTVREWAGMTDGEVANAIFAGYGFTPAAGNTDDDSPQHDPDRHSLFQRASDLQFLRGLARRNGKLCRVACADTPGVRTGYFVTPDVGGQPVATLTLADPDLWSVDALHFDWDVMRPSEVDASQVPLDSGSDVVSGDATSSGLAPLDARDYATYSGSPATLRLTATADAPELTLRSAATLREASWFVRCLGEGDIERLGSTLRVGTVVAVAGAGSLHSGNWYVWRVRHRITADSITVRFTLVRNAIGPAPPGGLPGSLPAVGGPA